MLQTFELGEATAHARRGERWLVTRTQTQQRTRAGVLAAARDELAEHGFRAAGTGAIAERAGLTRGAVYFNLSGKRALCFAVLAELAERAPSTTGPAPGRARRGRGPRRARPGLGHATGVRRGGAGRPRLRGGRARRRSRAGAAGLGADLIPEVTADEGPRRPNRRLLEVDALLVAPALEALQPLTPVPGAPPRRSVRLAKTVLTTLHGASRTAAAAPCFIEPFGLAGRPAPERRARSASEGQVPVTEVKARGPQSSSESNNRSRASPPASVSGASPGSGCSAQMIFPSDVYRVPQRSDSWATRNSPRPPSSVVAA
ncbi:helix-turn-helix transcriptional regulator [Streptomyces marianii]|uniref:Helix-turn-helix transcriptional regulator n=1 Tax=Streptomyces marianii TaxID=1817406 RepID=A0A5R9EBX4_9ACTN|nr:helix-turn-helix transcriptional regulator [Streptomyces marianii]